MKEVNELLSMSNKKPLPSGNLVMAVTRQNNKAGDISIMYHKLISSARKYKKEG